MKKITAYALFLALVGLTSMWLAGCTEEKLIEIAVGTEYFYDRQHGPSSSVEFENADTLSIAEKVSDALEGTRFDRSQITGMILNGVSYGVTEYTQTERWLIGGAVYVQRLDLGGSETVLLRYTDKYVPDLLGAKVVADLEPTGVDVINTALENFVDGDNPVLRFVTRNETVSPAPTPSNPIEFHWGLWIQYQIMVHESAKIFDPL
jgi:hypothetical protein